MPDHPRIPSHDHETQSSAPRDQVAIIADTSVTQEFLTHNECSRIHFGDHGYRFRGRGMAVLGTADGTVYVNFLPCQGGGIDGEP
jgi:hypothetical protein